MDALVDNIALCDELDGEEDRILSLINELFIDPYPTSNTFKEVADNEDYHSIKY